MNSIKEIKESARQSYLDQQTQDNEGGCADAVSYIGGFTAGAKWMQEKNAKEIEQLRTKIEQERSHIRTCHIAMEGHHKEIEQLKQRLEIAVEALEQITNIRRLDWNDHEYKGQEVWKARSALKKISAEKGEINEKI